MRVAFMLPIILFLILLALFSEGLVGMWSQQILIEGHATTLMRRDSMENIAQKFLLMRLKMFQYLGVASPQDMEARQNEYEKIVKDIQEIIKKDMFFIGILNIFNENIDEYKEIIKLHADFLTKKAYEKINGTSYQNMNYFL